MVYERPLSMVMVVVEMTAAVMFVMMAIVIMVINIVNKDLRMKV